MENTEYFSEEDWIIHQLHTGENQLYQLYSIQSKASFKTYFSLLGLFISSFSFLFFLYVVLSPSGQYFVNPDIYKFAGVLCVFSGAAAYRTGEIFQDYRVILLQVKEYIYRQRKAIDQVKEELHERRGEL